MLHVHLKAVFVLPAEAKQNDKIVSAELLHLMTKWTLPHLNADVAV